jgi:hypothetical protein
VYFEFKKINYGFFAAKYVKLDLLELIIPQGGFKAGKG